MKKKRGKQLVCFDHQNVNGQFQKISIPNHGRLPCFNPPCLWKFQNALLPPPPPPCPQNSIIVNPQSHNFQNFCFFWKYIFDLAAAQWTNEHEFVPPQGCDLATPGDKLYSSATRKPDRSWPAGYANSFLSLKLAIKIKPLTVVLLLFVLLCCLDVYKAK